MARQSVIIVGTVCGGEAAWAWLHWLPDLPGDWRVVPHTILGGAPEHCQDTGFLDAARALENDFAEARPREACAIAASLVGDAQSQLLQADCSRAQRSAQ